MSRPESYGRLYTIEIPSTESNVEETLVKYIRIWIENQDGKWKLMVNNFVVNWYDERPKKYSFHDGISLMWDRQDMLLNWLYREYYNVIVLHYADGLVSKHRALAHENTAYENHLNSSVGGLLRPYKTNFFVYKNGSKELTPLGQLENRDLMTFSAHNHDGRIELMWGEMEINGEIKCTPETYWIECLDEMTEPGPLMQRRITTHHEVKFNDVASVESRICLESDNYSRKRHAMKYPLPPKKFCN